VQQSRAEISNIDAEDTLFLVGPTLDPSDVNIVRDTGGRVYIDVRNDMGDASNQRITLTDIRCGQTFLITPQDGMIRVVFGLSFIDAVPRITGMDASKNVVGIW
jgi:hypothetical protein